MTSSSSTSTIKDIYGEKITLPYNIEDIQKYTSVDKQIELVKKELSIYQDLTKEHRNLIKNKKKYEWNVYFGKAQELRKQLTNKLNYIIILQQIFHIKLTKNPQA